MGTSIAIQYKMHACPRLSPVGAAFMDLEITPTLKIPDAELRLSFARSSGPGGQNVNKVSSKAILHFDVRNSPSLPPDVRARFLSQYASRITTAGEIVIHSEEYRD